MATSDFSVNLLIIRVFGHLRAPPFAPIVNWLTSLDKANKMFFKGF